MKTAIGLLILILTVLIPAGPASAGGPDGGTKLYLVHDRAVDLNRINLEIESREREIRFNLAEIMKVEFSSGEAGHDSGHDDRQAQIESLKLKNEVLRSEIEDLARQKQASGLRAVASEQRDR